MTAHDDADDPLLEALDAVLVTARANIVAWVGVMERADRIRELRRRGVPYREMALDAVGPSLIDTVAANQERLTTAGAQFRRAAARQLHNEGMSVADIARSFGVSRQRVGSLLRD